MNKNASLFSLKRQFIPIKTTKRFFLRQSRAFFDKNLFIYSNVRNFTVGNIYKSVIAV